MIINITKDITNELIDKVAQIFAEENELYELDTKAILVRILMEAFDVLYEDEAEAFVPMLNKEDKAELITIFEEFYTKRLLEIIHNRLWE